MYGHSTPVPISMRSTVIVFSRVTGLCGLERSYRVTGSARCGRAFGWVLDGCNIRLLGAARQNGAATERTRSQSCVGLIRARKPSIGSQMEGQPGGSGKTTAPTAGMPWLRGSRVGVGLGGFLRVRRGSRLGSRTAGNRQRVFGIGCGGRRCSIAYLAIKSIYGGQGGVGLGGFLRVRRGSRLGSRTAGNRQRV